MHDRLDNCQDCHETNHFLDDLETQCDNSENEQVESLSKEQSQEEGQSNDENMVKTSITTPHICTYYRVQRYVFSTSKRKRDISPQAIKTVDKGK